MTYLDQQTNSLYFSKLLVKKYPKFSKKLFDLLDKYSIHYETISHTKDIWMRDYMPIQTTDNHFIRYIHKPDYLKEYAHLRSDPQEVSAFLPSEQIIDIELNLDGGNIVRATDKIICSEKIFTANAQFSKKKVLDILKKSLQISEVIIVPKEPFEMTGHADGMVRFIDEKSVMITPYKEEAKKFEKSLLKSLMQHNLKIVLLPPKGYYRDSDDGVWIPYINYMQVANLIIIPIVGSTIEDEVITFFKHHFSDCSIEYIDATEIIKEGGALNCISWNIYKPHTSEDKDA